MNFLAYFLYHAPGAAAPILWLINILIFLVIAVILWVIVKWAAAEFGVPPQIVKAIGLLLFLLLMLFLLVGCAGTGPNGAFTAEDTAAMASTIDTAAHAYQQVRYAPTYPAAPVVYPAPVYPLVR